jgi:hypothetical protein
VSKVSGFYARRCAPLDTGYGNYLTSRSSIADALTNLWRTDVQSSVVDAAPKRRPLPNAQSADYTCYILPQTLVAYVARGGAEIPSTEDTRKALSRLSRARLQSECEDRLPPRPEDDPWDKLLKDQLVTALMEGLKPAVTLELVAEGLTQTRAPSVGGPSWYFDTSKHNVDTLKDRLVNHPPLVASDRVRQVSVEFQSSDLLDAKFILDYREPRLGVMNGQPVDYEVRHQARAVFDLSDGVLTISADSNDDAIKIGEAILLSLDDNEQARVSVSIVPAVKNKKLSTPTLEMVDAIWGRMGAICEVINVEKAWTRRKEEDSSVEEETAKGSGRDVLEDKKLRERIVDGDLIGVRCVVKYVYSFNGKERVIRSKITFSRQSDGMFLRVAKGDYSEDRMIELYQQIRRSLLATPNDEAKARIRSAIKQIIS